MIKYINNEKYFGFLPDDKKPNIKNTIQIKECEKNVTVLKFPCFEKTGFIQNGFSTRNGGVSEGIYSSMNLTFNMNDKSENVLENFRIISETLDIPVERMVYSKQTHTTNVLKVDSSYCGMGILKDRNFDNIDGLITNEPGVCLVTSFADCVPLFFADIKHKAIASSHSGWRGTVGNIAGNTIELMNKEYGTRPEDLIVMTGPCICEDCYEVSEDVAEQFNSKYITEQAKHIVKKSAKQGKYQLNLPMANYYNFINEGVRPENIYISDICTCCNSDLLFSHRATKGKRGILCGFFCIK